GLDSSLLCALAMRQGADPVTFSISFSEGRFDESEQQRLVAEHLGTRHHVVRCGPADIAAALPEVVRHAETVLLRTAPAPLLLLSGLAHEHGLKAVLTGEGADEFAVGYDLFKETAVRAFWARQPASHLRPQLFRRLYPDIPELRELSPAFLAAFFGADAAQVDSPGFSHRPRWRTTGRLRRLLRQEVVAAAAPVQARDLAELLGSVAPGLHPVAAAQAIEVQTFLEPQLLAAQGDRMAMAHSVESRLPYLDHRVVELLGRLPVSAKLRGLEEKAMLRCIARPLLPPAITARTKQPYRAPIGSVVTPALLDELLDPAWVAADGVLRPEAVATLRRRAAGPVGETDAMALSALASYALLRRELFGGRPVPAATLSRLWDRRYAAISGSGLNCVR
ncbi:MAG: asparagine synthetase B family protein, partial [Candidatus Dormibacteraceae bacterium]